MPAKLRDIVPYWTDFLLMIVNDPDKTQEDITLEAFSEYFSQRLEQAVIARKSP
jgi:hypothetical protein